MKSLFLGTNFTKTKLTTRKVLELALALYLIGDCRLIKFETRRSYTFNYLFEYSSATFENVS